MLSKSCLSPLLLTFFTVSAKPVSITTSLITLPIVRHFNLNGSATFLQMDQARVSALLADANGLQDNRRSLIVNEPIDNNGLVYTATVGVGSPATSYELMIGFSANTWIGAGKAYVKTATSKQTTNKVSVRYGSGSFSGTQYTDQVTIGGLPGLVIPAQSIGVAETSTGFAGYDGLLGIGPTALSKGSLSPDTTALIPTVTDNLFNQGSISNNEISISFNPTTTKDVVNGVLTWGGTDSSKYTGKINYTPVTSTFPSSAYWGIDQSVTYGSSRTTILSFTAGVVEPAVTLVYLSTDAFNRYKDATGAVTDDSNHFLTITPAQYANLQSLFFEINGVSYEFSANAQIWPRSLNSVIGGVPGLIYLVINDLGGIPKIGGTGLEFINGYVFLERHYAVFDTSNKRIGFATTPNTFATTN